MARVRNRASGPTVGDVAAWMERFAPRRLAETWDNVGLLWGDPSSPARSVMTCLTVAASTAAEAVDASADLIVSHHPVLFRGAKSVRADHRDTGFLWSLARAGISILSPHTAFDNTAGGINDLLAERLGLVDVAPLRPGAPRQEFKLVVFVPARERETILAAAFGSGAGKIGEYSECSFTTEGQGTFRGGESSNPTIGEPGRRESVDELKIELVCEGRALAGVLAAIREAHSYEEPAIDVIPLHAGPDGAGVGRVGQLPEAETLKSFAGRVSRLLDTPSLQYAGDPARKVERVAIACGAGDDFLGDAAQARVDALLTGEARYHRAVEAEARGLGLVIAGHHATEWPGVEDLARRVSQEFPTINAWASRRERDPWRTCT